MNDHAAEAVINKGAVMMTSTFWYRLPAAARIAATGLFGLGAGIALSDVYYSAAGTISGFGMVLAGYVAVAALISAVVAERVKRRDFGSTQQYVVYAGALRSGELPARIEPDMWRGWLARTRRLNRQAPVMALLLVVFGIERGLRYPSLDHLIVVGFLGMCTAAIVFNWQLQRGRIAHLTAAVERRTGESPTD
jgi:hypothetical protein